MVTDEQREINAKSGTHYGQKSLAVNDGQTLFKAAGAIVFGVKHNERHKEAKKIKWKRQISQKLCGQMESCKITMTQGRGRLNRRSIVTGR